MATTLWGKVYYNETYAGILQQEPGGRCIFAYDTSYLNSSSQPIAFSFPLREDPFISENGLHPFFDNLGAEGWLEEAQARALKTDINNRFGLLLGFGYDLAGAVSIIDPTPQIHSQLDHADQVTNAVALSRASLSGIQRKLLVIKEGSQYRPTRINELSTHIAKLPSGDLTDIIEVEYLTTQAVKELLPNDSIVEMEIATINSINEPALVIKRFDRIISNSKISRLHFEEFNQLLGHHSGRDKYEGSYETMGKFIATTPGCLPAEIDRLYRRILACLLVGNTDAHFKNFAMLHTRDGLRLTPSYDLVAAARYKNFYTIALSIGNASNLDIGALKAKHLIDLGRSFGLNDSLIFNAVNELGKRLDSASQAVAKSKIDCSPKLRETLINIMEKRWKGSFDSIGQLLSKRQSKGEKHRI